MDTRRLKLFKPEAAYSKKNKHLINIDTPQLQNSLQNSLQISLQTLICNGLHSTITGVFPSN